MVISKSVDLKMVFSDSTLIRTQLRIGRVDLVGVALETFCEAFVIQF